jgi:predicted small secreted protein
MKKLIILFFSGLMLLLVTACGTVGGAIDGAGDDLKRAGQWVKNR